MTFKNARMLFVKDNDVLRGQILGISDIVFFLSTFSDELYEKWEQR